MPGFLPCGLKPARIQAQRDFADEIGASRAGGAFT